MVNEQKVIQVKCCKYCKYDEHWEKLHYFNAFTVYIFMTVYYFFFFCVFHYWRNVNIYMGILIHTVIEIFVTKTYFMII